MFLKFSSDKERIAAGGTAFIEIQYCRLPKGTKNKKLITAKSLQFWDLSSLYIKDTDIKEFCYAYAHILDEALNGGEDDTFDVYGVNYYNNIRVKEILHQIEREEPLEYEILAQWIRSNPYDNGIYILGI